MGADVLTIDADTWAISIVAYLSGGAYLSYEVVQYILKRPDFWELPTSRRMLALLVAVCIIVPLWLPLGSILLYRDRWGIWQDARRWMAKCRNRFRR